MNASRVQVETQIAELDSALAFATDRLELLELRLSAVVRQPDPPAPDGPTAIREDLVPLAEMIRQTADRAGALGRRTDSILSRLEL